VGFALQRNARAGRQENDDGGGGRILLSSFQDTQCTSHAHTPNTGHTTMPNPLPASPLLLLVLVGSLLSLSHAFSTPSRPPSPHSPYDRRPPPSTPPSTPATKDRGSNLYRPFNPLLGPGSRVAIAGADAPEESNNLSRLITKKLFASQMRPYLLVPSMDKVPTGLGFDQYKGLTRYICTQPVDERKEGDGKISEIDGLVLCSEKGYTAKQVRELLARVEEVEEEDGRGGGGGTGEKKRLKRVVMLSSLGVNRREDVFWKLRQFGVDLEERVSLVVLWVGRAGGREGKREREGLVCEWRVRRAEGREGGRRGLRIL